ncbi:MAG: dihydrolipoyl dehydrogenase [Geminicoccaceae bacterium]|nr:dihydrolipoyl dehydrogenase [Geminicoccaceae bacterium]
MSEPVYDVVVIGGGPGGYVAAIKAAQLGMKVACVEKRPTLGGTCLNVGCIPSKALLHASHLYEETRHGLERFGIRTGEPQLDLAAMLDYKDKVVEGLTRGIEFLFKRNGVEFVRGHGRIAQPGRVVVATPEGASRELATKNIVIATGSEPATLDGVAIDEERIVTSTGALALARVPRRLLVVGAGYIGLELGTVWRRLGAEVTVVEFLDRITPGMDAELARELQRALARQGMVFRLGRKVVEAETTEEGVAVVVEPVAGGPPETLVAEVVLVAIGRRPYTEGLAAAELGLTSDERGRIRTDGHFRTSVPGIWAIGDVIEGPMLAHKAEEDGIHCIELIAGQKPQHDYDRVPSVIYTRPEVAAVGKTEEQLKAEGRAYKVGKFPFAANSRARTIGANEGFVKILADAETDRLLGCHVIGPEAGTMIAELALAMEFGATAEDIARTCHPHPTLEEAVKEAALAAWAKPIHL